MILDTRLNAISNEKQTRSFWCHFFIESFWLPLEKSHACSSQLISSHCVFLNTTWTCAFKNAGANAISDPLKCGETFIKIYRFCRKKMSTRYGSPIKNWPYGVKLPLWVELFYPTYNDWLGAHLDPLILQEPVLKVLIEAEGGKSTGNISAKMWLPTGAVYCQLGWNIASVAKKWFLEKNTLDNKALGVMNGTLKEGKWIKIFDPKRKYNKYILRHIFPPMVNWWFLLVVD